MLIHFSEEDIPPSLGSQTNLVAENYCRWQSFLHSNNAVKDFPMTGIVVGVTCQCSTVRVTAFLRKASGCVTAVRCEVIIKIALSVDHVEL
jgi:hypothetical protein